MSERPPLPWRPVVFAMVVAAAIALALHVVSVVTGDRTPVEGHIDFTATAATPSAPAVATATQASPVLRFAIAPVVSPETSLRAYQATGDLLGLQSAFQHERLTFVCQATAMEYLVGLFLVAIGMGVFWIGQRIGSLQAAGRTKAMIGKVVVTQTVRPGVISFALGFGHWSTGAGDMVVDGHLIKGEPRRQAGVHANAAMWIDPALKNTCFLDPVGGSVSFYDTQVKLVPA